MGVEIFIVFAFAAMVFWGVGDFLIQKTVRKIGDVEALFFVGAIGSVGLFPFILSDIELLFVPENIFVLGLLGLLTFFATVFNFEALKRGKISVVEVILELELPVTVVLGYLFFGEFLSLWQFLLIVPIFIGIVLMALESLDIKKSGLLKHFEKGVVFALIGALGMAFINSITAVSARQVSPLMAIWVPAVVFSFICLIILIKNNRLKNLLVDVGKERRLILLMGVFDTLAWVAYAFATSLYNIGVVTAITEAYPAIGIMLGVMVNHEKVKPHQYAGAAITLIACIVLAVTI